MKLEHPYVAALIVIIFAGIISNYGIVYGSLFVVDVLLGILIYKIITKK